MTQPNAVEWNPDHYPPAAEGLPAGTLESAVAGAAIPDANAETPYGRNVHAHALVRLQRDGWLREAPEWFDSEACTSMSVHVGPEECIDGDCDEYATEDGDERDIDHCSHITTEQVCEEHSEFYDGEVCTHAEPWPCQAVSRPSA